MPELPEVETTRRGIFPHLKNQRVISTQIRESRLRWPVPRNLSRTLQGKTLIALHRRGKYLLFQFDNGHLLVHLGMSGSLRIISRTEEYRKHDHIEIAFANNKQLRFHDPRRFGCVLWLGANPSHELLDHLGVEPLGDQLTGKYLHQKSRNKKLAVKNFLMDGRILVGVGNIYANEALFFAGIRPRTAASRISLKQYERLVEAIKKRLTLAIESGGTTLRDFVNSDGEPGYFKQQLMVYGRGGKACRRCKTPIKEIKLGQRSTFYCPQCQS